MRKLVAAMAGCLLLSMSFSGSAQQAPGEVVNQQDGLERLQVLLKAQTEAIKALRDRVDKLESRLKKLEESRPPGDSR